MGLLFIFIKLMTLSDIFLQSFRFKPQTACVRKQGFKSELFHLCFSERTFSDLKTADFHAKGVKIRLRHNIKIIVNTD